MNNFSIVVVGFCLLVSFTGIAAEGEKYLNSTMLITGIKNDNKAVGVLDAFGAERKRLVVQLNELLDDNTQAYDFRARSAKLLGIIKAAEAIDVLIKNLKLAPETVDKKTFEIVCPCGNALIQIGSASRKALVDRLILSQDTGERNLLVIVLVEIEGYEVAEFLVSNRQKAEPNFKNNLQVAIDLISELKDRNKN